MRSWFLLIIAPLGVLAQSAPVNPVGVGVDAQSAPVITQQPLDTSAPVGGYCYLRYTVSAASTTSALSAKVLLNGQPAPIDFESFPDATYPTAEIKIGPLALSDTGTLQVQVTNAAGTTSSRVCALTVTNAPVPSRLMNLSIRTSAGIGDQTLIVGFVIGGANTSGYKDLIVRGIGPSLAPLGINGVLPNPVLTIFDNSRTPILGIQGWQSSLQTEMNAVGAFPIPVGSNDAALGAVALNPGLYSAEVVDANNATGIALAEIYDASGATTTLSANSPRLINVSARAAVGTGDGVLIAGFAIQGSQPKTVLIRAIGPTLANFNVGGVLADPNLTLQPLGSNTIIASNDNWSGSADMIAVFNQVGAFPLNQGSKDSGLPPIKWTQRQAAFVSIDRYWFS